MKKTMQAVVLHGVNDLRMEELPIPKPGPGQVLVKNRVAGVCGTDVHMWAGTNFEGKFPFVPGHEWVGEVVELGAGVRTVKAGDRVTGECFVPCRVCDVCKVRGAPPFCPNHTYFGFQPEAPGAMAEYTLSPEERLHKIPANLSDDEAALVEPVSVAYHAIWGRGGGAAPHDRIGVFGAGPIGLFATQIASVSGAQVVVVEPASYRQKMARAMGAEAIVNPIKEDWKAQIMELTGGLGFTLIVECSGNQSAIASSVDLIAVDGRIVLTGQSMGVKVPIELGKLIWTHGRIVGSCDSPGYWPKAIAYISRKRADVTRIITHRFPLAQAPAAFDVALQGVESGKVVLDI